MHIQIQFKSNCLSRIVSYEGYLPDNGVNNETDSLVVLHGITDNARSWQEKTSICQFYENKNKALFFINGDNSFYVNRDPSKRYADFVGRELVEHTKKVFGLSDDRKKWTILGNSMGGYGAIHVGLKYQSNFAHIIALSPALVIEKAWKSDDQAKLVFEQRSFFESTFGDLDTILISEKNPKYQIDEYGFKVPLNIFMSCGTEDFLLETNRDFHHFLLKKDVRHHYHEEKGNHDWSFWNKQIPLFDEWLKKNTNK